MGSDNYIVVQGWMCNELGLKGNELLIFAMIHGFSQDGVSKFHGGRKYIADTFNISLPTVDKALQSLVSKQYICKEGFDDFVNPNIYWVNFEVVKKLYEGSKETLQGGSKETLHNKDSKQTDKEKRVSKDNTTNFAFGKTKPKKQSLYTKCVSLIDEKTNNQEIRRLLIDWLNMLLEKYRSRNRVLYVNVFKGKLNMLDKFDKKDWKEIIEYNLQRGYEGFYPISNTSYTKEYDVTKGKAWEENVSCRQATKEEQEEIDRLNREREAKGMRIKF